MAQGNITPGGVALRIGLAIALVLATLNPTRWNYLRWATESIEEFGPEKLIAGLLLAAAWVLYVRAALQSIGFVGAALIAGIVAAFVWLAIDKGWLDPDDTSALMWIALIAFGLILGIGLSWSRFRRRITGQVDVEGDSPLS
jgi:drug/metabolite transporter (DMT)-like permease